MKLLLDENLSPRLVGMIADLFPGSAHVHDVGLGGQDDRAVWSYAKGQGFAVLSKDSDFMERSVLDGYPPKVIWVRLGNCSTAEIARVLRSKSEAVQRFLEAVEETCLLLG